MYQQSLIWETAKCSWKGILCAHIHLVWILPSLPRGNGVAFILDLWSKSIKANISLLDKRFLISPVSVRRMRLKMI